MDKEDIIRMAREAGFADGVVDIVGFEGFANFAALVAAHERKECAKISETPFLGEQDDITMQAKDRVATAIRARG